MARSPAGYVCGGNCSSFLFYIIRIFNQRIGHAGTNPPPPNRCRLLSHRFLPSASVAFTTLRFSSGVMNSVVGLHHCDGGRSATGPMPFRYAHTSERVCRVSARPKSRRLEYPPEEVSNVHEKREHQPSWSVDVQRDHCARSIRPVCPHRGARQTVTPATNAMLATTIPSNTRRRFAARCAPFRN